MISLFSSSMFSYPKETGRQNEDTILPPRRVGDGFLIAIADGVGSYAGASQASQAAIDVLSSISEEESNLDLSAAEIFTRIRNQVVNLSTHNSKFLDAATTLTFCYINNLGLRIGHIGDCRVYIRKGRSLQQLTVDQTQHQRLIDEGLYKPSELKNLKVTNALYSAISRKTHLDFQEVYIPRDEITSENGFFEIIMMSDGAYHFWDIRPRFVVDTLLNPNRFAASLHRRIDRLGPIDDHSLLAAKFHIG